jgi:hypothetical protein
MLQKVVLAICFLSGSLWMQAQQKQQITIEKGAVLTINEPVSNEFRYIKFPRKNFIIKRGAIADLKSVYGKEVEVIDFSYTDSGDTKVTLKRTDGKKFFRYFRTVDAYLEDALTSGELIK